MKHGLYVPNFGVFADPSAVAELAVVAEETGWDGLFVWDHVVRAEGDFDLADPWTLLASVAIATSRLTIGPLITPLPRRRPWNVAKSSVTLDHLSNGRMVVGVGAGTIRGPEFAAFGEETDPRVRGDMLDEGLAIVRAAWTGAPVSHTGVHYRIDGQRFLPRPVRGHIPIWGATERLSGRPVRRAATLDGIFPIGIRPTDVPAMLEHIAQFRPAGSEGYDVVVTGTDDPAPWHDTGVTWWLRLLAFDQPIADAISCVRSGP